MNKYRKGPTGVSVVQFLIMINIFAILILGIITGVMLLAGEQGEINIGYPWVYYHHNSLGGQVDTVWNFKALMGDFMIAWFATLVIFLVWSRIKAKITS